VKTDDWRRNKLTVWICFQAALAAFSTHPASLLDRIEIRTLPERRNPKPRGNGQSICHSSFDHSFGIRHSTFVILCHCPSGVVTSVPGL
jgi:hypothetical protein